jgi:hypothetical protein
MKYTTTSKMFRTYIFLLLFFILSVAGLYFIFGNIPDADRVSLLLEVAKFLLQIITLLVIAGLVSKLVRSFEKDRKADKALHDFRSGILNDLEALYQKIKKSQHILRSAGLTYAFNVQIVTMSDKQVESYGVEMTKLNEAQLELEKIELGIERFPGSFSKSTDLKSKLGEMEAYLNDLLTEYAQLWPKLSENKSNVLFSNFKVLIDFTGSGDSRYASTFSTSYGNAVGFIREDLLPLKLVLQNGAGTSAEALTKPDA